MMYKVVFRRFGFSDIEADSVDDAEEKAEELSVTDIRWSSNCELLKVCQQELKCDTEECVFCHNGTCRYDKVYDKAPLITENDGCQSSVLKTTKR